MLTLPVGGELVSCGSLPLQGTDYAQTRNDAFGRPIETLGLDGKVRSRTRYHALSVDRWDAEDIGPGPHQGTYASEHQDGFGRTTRTTVRVRECGVTDLRHLDRTYLPTGELTSLVRWHGDESAHVPGADAVTRTMRYDSLGRMIENFEPSTSEGPLEDYSPCEVHHVPHSPSPEVQYHYDLPDPEADAALPGVGQTFTLGKVTSVRDRASKVLSRVDLRGRVTHTAKKVAAPDGSFDTRWYHRESTFDAADRPVHTTTGATQFGESAVTKSYTRRGTVRQVVSSYGTLVERVRRTAEGTVTEVKYGDAAGTTTVMVHDDLRRLRNLTTYRSNQPAWTNDEGTQQMLLQDTQLVYDRAGNPTEIRDWRMPQEWEPGAKPVSRKMEYDDLYRLKRIDYQHTDGDATWVDPFDAETVDPTRPQPSPRRSFSKRVLRQTFAYDWLGNTIHTDDDQHAFYDRSLGPITNGGGFVVPGRLVGSAAMSDWPGVWGEPVRSLVLLFGSCRNRITPRTRQRRMLRFRFTLPCVQFAIRAAPKVKAWVIVSVLLFACQSPIHTHGPVNSPANAGGPSHDTEEPVPAGLSAARWTVDDAPIARPPTGWASLNAGYSVRYHQPVGMNAELARSGYTQVEPTVRGVTTSVEIATGRLRFGIMDFAGGSRTYRLSNSDAQFDVSTMWIAPATVGYELVQLSGSINDRWWILSAYPMVGIAVGILTLQYEPGSPLILAEHLSAVDSNLVQRNSGLVLFGLGTEYIHLFSPGQDSLGIRADLRTGYYQEVISGSWTVEGEELPQAPSLDMSAPFVRFTVGLVHSFR